MFYEALSSEPEFIFSIILALIVFGLSSLTILGIAGMWTWRKHQAAKIDATLKADMVAAGMSAEEIERVLAAKATVKQLTLSAQCGYSLTGVPLGLAAGGASMHTAGPG